MTRRSKIRVSMSFHGKSYVVNVFRSGQMCARARLETTIERKVA